MHCLANEEVFHIYLSVMRYNVYSDIPHLQWLAKQLIQDLYCFA